MKRTHAYVVDEKLITSGGSNGFYLNEDIQHQVLSSAFTLELIFGYLHPRDLCAAVRVNATWHAVAYAQPTLWCDWNVEECFKSTHPRDVLGARFGRLRSIVVPASFVKSQRDDIKSYLRGNFTELQSLSLCIPPKCSIDPSDLSHFTSLTTLSLEILNPACASAYGALVMQSSHLRALTYLTRPWKAVNNFPFSVSGLMLERLEVNQIDFEDIVHMASSLKSLKIAGYPKIDKYTRQICIRSVESITHLSALENLDISLLDPSEVSNPSWVAMHVYMLSNLQRLDVGPLFATHDFTLMPRDMPSLRAVGISNNPHFSSSILQYLSLGHFAFSLTSLSLRNCIDALSDAGCLASFAALRTLHIEQDPPHGGTLRKLVPTVVLMTQLEDLALVGLSINPVMIYPKLTRLQRLVLNHTPTSDADVLIMSKKLPALRHLGLLGCYHVTLQGLMTLLSVVSLRVLEWDEQTHVQRLVRARSNLCVVSPSLKEPLEPLIHLL